MFLKNNKNNSSAPTATTAPAKKKESIPSILAHGMHVQGNITSEGVMDVDGAIEGNIACSTLTLRARGHIKGEVIADTVHIYGKLEGMIRARNVNLYSSCHIEGIITHESLTIEDGAFIDGKFKRADKAATEEKEQAPLLIAAPTPVAAKAPSIVSAPAVSATPQAPAPKPQLVPQPQQTAAQQTVVPSLASQFNMYKDEWEEEEQPRAGGLKLLGNNVRLISG